MTKAFLSTVKRGSRSTGKLTFISIDYHTSSGKCEFLQFVEMLKDCLIKVAAADKASRKAMFCAAIANACENQAIKRAREIQTYDELDDDGILTFLKCVHSACFSTLMAGTLRRGGRKPNLFQTIMRRADHFLDELEVGLEAIGLGGKVRVKPVPGLYVLPSSKEREEGIAAEERKSHAIVESRERIFTELQNREGEHIFEIEI
jgi:hypothetical protein